MGYAWLTLCILLASVFINDDESGLHHDFEVWLEKLAPHEPINQYQHNNGEDNADAHLKRSIMGREVVVAVTCGKLDFATAGTDFTGNLTANAESGFWLRLSANRRS